MHRIVIENIPSELRRNYKAFCTLKDMTMKEDLMTYMNACIGNEKSIYKIIRLLISVAAQNHNDGEAEKTKIDNIKTSIEELISMPSKDGKILLSFEEYKNMHIQMIEI